MPTALQIRCFGRFEVVRDGVPVQRWRRDRAKALLKSLVVQRRPVPRDVLLDQLWPGVAPGAATRNLRAVLHALRQAIGTWNNGEPRNYVRQDGDQLFLDPSAPVWIDTDMFMAHVEAAEGLESAGRRTEAAHEYAQADHIYRDDFLLEDALEQWSLLRREELKDRYQVVLARLADYFIESGDLMACISCCHKLLSQDSCREDAYFRLMYCHTALGQRSRAVRWYRMCETTLIADLGMGPGERTRSLYQRIVSGASLLPSIDWLIGSRRDPRVNPAI